MTLLQSIVLGIIQGLTEFLPISSSAHLVIAPYLLGWDFTDQAEFIFDVLVQLGTLVAVLVYFWRDLVSIARAFILGLWHKKPFADLEARLGWWLIIASIPAALGGLWLKDAVEKAFSSPLATSLFLILTAGFLVAAERLGKRTRQLEQLTGLDALVIGVFQAVSLFPGVSRSGSTITAGMLRGLDRRPAARFSFLMSVPVMLGAGALAMVDLFQYPDFSALLPSLVAGFIAAAVVGYLSIRWLLGYLTRHSLYIFAGYCLLLSLTVLIVFLFRGTG